MSRLLTGSYGNEPFGSRPEPGIYMKGLILVSLHGEVPKGRARVDQQPTCLCAVAQSKARAGNGRYEPGTAA